MTPNTRDSNEHAIADVARWTGTTFAAANVMVARVVASA